MKKVLVLLLVFLPCLCWGQSKQIENIKIKKEGLLLDIPARTDIANIVKYPAIFNILPGRMWDPFPTYYSNYEATVIAPGFGSFLATQKSEGFYSLSYLKNKNTLMATEWNSRCKRPMIYDSKIYEQEVDYNSMEYYGKDVEYTIYMFFRFMEKENGMLLINDKQLAGI